MNKLFVVGISLSLFSFVSCVKVPEMTLAEIEAITQKSNDELVKKHRKNRFKINTLTKIN